MDLVDLEYTYIYIYMCIDTYMHIYVDIMLCIYRSVVVSLAEGLFYRVIVVTGLLARTNETKLSKE